MIANARMYSVNSAASAAWRALLGWALHRADVQWEIVDHAAPAPMSALWTRDDLGAALMCGLPYSLRTRRPELIAAPIPSPTRYMGQPRYMTDIAVRADAPFTRIEDTFGNRIGFTVADSQSGYYALRHFLAPYQHRRGGALYREVVGGLLNARGVIDALAAGTIDVGPLDSYSHDLLAHLEPAYAAQVRIVATTEWTPIPAFVATAPLAPDVLSRLRNTFVEAGTDPALAETRRTLLLAGFALPDARSYVPLRDRHDALNRVAELW